MKSEKGGAERVRAEGAEERIGAEVGKLNISNLDRVWKMKAKKEDSWMTPVR